jgi:hypothetical protein
MLASDDDVQKSNATETTGPDPGSGVASSAAISLLDNPVIRLDAKAEDDKLYIRNREIEPTRRSCVCYPQYQVEYSASFRSTCKVCQKQIEKGELRLGHTIPGKADYFSTSRSRTWYIPFSADATPFAKCFGTDADATIAAHNAAAPAEGVAGDSTDAQAAAAGEVGSIFCFCKNK